MSVKKSVLIIICMTLMFVVQGMPQKIHASASSNIEEEDVLDRSPPKTTPKKKKKEKKESPATELVLSTPSLILEKSSSNPDLTSSRRSPDRRHKHKRDSESDGDIVIEMQRAHHQSAMHDPAESDEESIDLKEDIPGCEDNYYRCCLCCFRLSRGWVDFGVALTLIGGAITSGITTYAHFDNSTMLVVGNITTGLLIAGAVLKVCKTYLMEAVITRTQDLETIIRQHKIHEKKKKKKKAEDMV